MFNLTTWLIISLVTSVIVNILVFWYIRRVLYKLFFVSENIGDLVQILGTYKNHLRSVYELETYYGDETIKFLMSHTASLLDMLEDYEDIYSITVPIIEEEFDEEEIIEGEQINGQTQINEENVFYAGSRRRDS